MIVLQLGPYPPPHGGVQINLVAIREHLRQRQISSPVINLIQSVPTGADEVYYPRTALQVLRLLWAIRADVVHIHIGGRLTARLLGLCFVCSLIPRTKVVLTFHSGGYASTAAGRRARAFSLRGMVFRRLDAIIAVNAEIAGLFRRFGVQPARIRVICPYVPVSVSSATELPALLEKFRRSHTPMLTTVGLLEPDYDLPMQIRSLARVRRTFPQAGLVIVGSGSMEEELRRLIAAQAERDHILLCGDLPHHVTLRTIAESDLFLRTTLYDGDSLAVREALQLGAPVIATDNGMRPDGVHLVPVSSPDALCARVESLLREPIRREPISLAPSVAAEAVLELYRSLVGHATGSVANAPA